jgi:hypothetical protein
VGSEPNPAEVNSDRVINCKGEKNSLLHPWPAHTHPTMSHLEPRAILTCIPGFNRLTTHKQLLCGLAGPEHVHKLEAPTILGAVHGVVLPRRL